MGQSTKSKTQPRSSQRLKNYCVWKQTGENRKKTKPQ